MNGIRFLLNKTTVFSIDIYLLLAFYLNIDMIEGIISNFFVFFLNREALYIINIMFELICIPFIVWFGLLKKKINCKILIFAVIYYFLYLISCFLNPEIFPILRRGIIRGTLNTILVVYLFSLLPSLTPLFNRLKPYAYIGVLYAVSRALTYRSTFLPDTIYMDFTYNSMIPMLTAMMLMVYNDSDKSIKSGLFKSCFPIFSFLIMFTANILYGSRGALLCVSIAALMVFFFVKGKTQILLFVIATLTCTILAVEHETILNYLLQLFPNTRTLQRLAGGYFINTTTSWRSGAFKLIWENFIYNPFKISGFLSDRVFLSQYFPIDADFGIHGMYAHNFVLEILYQFGIFGIPFILWLCKIVIKLLLNLKRSSNASLRSIFVVAVAFCGGQLMFSSSYLLAKSFGLLMGIVLYMNVCESEGTRNDKSIAGC